MDVGFHIDLNAKALEQVNRWFPAQIDSAVSLLQQLLKHILKLFFITLHCNIGILQPHYYLRNIYIMPPTESNFKYGAFSNISCPNVSLSIN